MLRTRCSLVIAPPEMHIAPSLSAPPNADQKPMNGPKENAKKTRSAAVTPAARYTWSDQMPVHHTHDSAVSSQRSGASPLEPEVWCMRTYRSSGYVRFVPNGGCDAWSATSSDLFVSGSRSKSSQPSTSCRRSRQNAFVRRMSFRPDCSFLSCSSLIADRSVADLEDRVEDLEALIQLGLLNAQRWVGHDRVPAHERVHTRVHQRLRDRLHLR